MKIILECIDKEKLTTSIQPENSDEETIIENVKKRDGNLQFIVVCGIKHLQLNGKGEVWTKFKTNKTPGSKLVIDLPDLNKLIEEVERRKN